MGHVACAENPPVTTAKASVAWDFLADCPRAAAGGRVTEAGLVFPADLPGGAATGGASVAAAVFFPADDDLPPSGEVAGPQQTAALRVASPPAPHSPSTPPPTPSPRSQKRRTLGSRWLDHRRRQLCASRFNAVARATCFQFPAPYFAT
ncbi:unnamed protein product [Closterium sp. Naga37s-1]|nr:unnamed protein product [Closterium sp. Naga37s-1]